MNLKKAIELRAEYVGQVHPIRVDNDGYICLTDMVKYFPNKRLDNWFAADSTKELIAAFNSNSLENKGIKAKAGRYGGTYAHELLAMDFAMWLSPEFKLKVYYEYINGTQNKKDWNIKRIHAAFNFRMMTDAIKDAHEDAKSYHYSNEAIMINEIVFGKHEPGLRESAREFDLDLIAALEGHNATLIGIGMNFDERKEKLKHFHEVEKKKLIKRIESAPEFAK